jgi:hypothetical protein
MTERENGRPDPLPFTDLSGAKVRPAVVVFRDDRPGDDVILAFLIGDVGAEQYLLFLGIPVIGYVVSDVDLR